MQPKIAGDDLACLLEVLRDFVIDHRQSKWTGIGSRCHRLNARPLQHF